MLITYKLYKRILSIIRMFNSNISPNHLAIGLGFGIFWGLSPFLSPHNLLLLFLLVLFKIPLNAGIIGMGLSLPFSFIFADAINALGRSILTSPALNGFWTEWFNSYWILSKFNNTFVMGSFIIALGAFIPAVIVFRLLIIRYRTSAKEKFFQSKFYVNFLAKTKIFDWYFKVAKELKAAPAPDTTTETAVTKKNTSALLGVIDWKFFIPVAVVVVAVVIGLKYYLDGAVGNLIRKEATEFNQALVELGGFSSSLRNQSASLHNLAWTDNKNYDQNLFQFDRFTANANLLALLRGSFVFDELSLINFRLNTPRETSGRVVLKTTPTDNPNSNTPSSSKNNSDNGLLAQAKAVSENKLADIKESFDQELNSTIKNTKDILNQEQERIVTENQALVKRYQEKVIVLEQDLNLKNEIATLKSVNINNIKDLPTAIAVAQKIGSVSEALKKAERAKNSVVNLEKDFNSDFKKLQQDLSPEAIKSRTLNIVLKSIGLNTLSLDGFSERIFGPVITDYISSFAGYYKQYKHLLVAKENPETKKTEVDYDPAIRSGEDIRFKILQPYPTFFVKTLRGSGDESIDGVHEIAVDNLSSDLGYAPLKNFIKLRERGITATLEGDAFIPKINGRLNVSQEIKTAPFTITDILSLAPNPLLNSVKQGEATVSGKLSDKNDRITLDLELNATDLGFAINTGLPPAISSVLDQAVDNIPRLMININYQEQKTSKPKIRIKSNLDVILKNKIDTAFKKFISEQRGRAQQEIEKQLGPQIIALQKSAGLGNNPNLFKDINQQLDIYLQDTQALQNKIKELENQQKQNVINQAVDQIKKQIKIPGFK